MTLPLNPRRNDYTGTGLLATYAYTFKIFADTELQLVVADANGVESAPLVKGVDYNVSGVGASGGGSITFISAGQAWLNAQGFLQANYHLSILGARDYKQDTSVRNQGAYFPNVLEDTFDKMVVLVQQLQEKAARAITWQKSSTMSGILIKAAGLAGYAGKMLRVTDDETGLQFTALTEAQFTAQANAASASALAAAQSAAASAASEASAAADAATALADANAAAASAAAAAASAASAAGAAGTAFKEVVVGVYAGGNTTFTLAHPPLSDAVLDTVLGAVPQYPTDYNLAAAVVTFVGQNLGGQSAMFKYRY